MASSPVNPKNCYHARSNSFPSRPHPFVTQINEHLCRLKASESTSSSSICQKLNSLQDLHDCVDKLLLLPRTQQTLAQEQHEKWVDEMFHGSLRLLDMCNTAKDAFLQTKECTHELQSTLRRRCGGDIIILTSEVKKYLTSRKAVKKAIHKAWKNLKGVENGCTSSPYKKDHETVTMVSMLREVESVTLIVFESLLSLISGPKTQSKLRSWSLVSKLMHHKRVASEEEGIDISEFAKVDAALHSLIGHKTSNSDNIIHGENAQDQLKNLVFCIQDLEEGLERLYRLLIKTRVSLLNIFNH